jgi:hypothetical protein
MTDQNFINLCEQIDIDPHIFDPDPQDEEPEFQHLKYKKRWLLRGYRCEGMQNPGRTLSLIIRDIQDRLAWKDLGPGGQGAYQTLRDKYREWIIRRHAAAPTQPHERS